MITLATEVALGRPVRAIRHTPMDVVAVKVPQFSFKRLRGADPVLRVEMSSTGEVAAFGKDRHEAYLKAILATGMQYPQKRAVFLSLGGDSAKQTFLSSTERLRQMGFVLYATSGTHRFLQKQGVASRQIGKIYEDVHPNYSDLLKNRTIGFSVVLPERFTDASAVRVEKGLTDGYMMRRMSIDLGIPIFTNAESASMFVESMQKYRIEQVSL